MKDEIILIMFQVNKEFSAAHLKAFTKQIRHTEQRYFTFRRQKKSFMIVKPRKESMRSFDKHTAKSV